MIRVVVVDDQAIVREGIRALLRIAGEVEVVGEAADGERALAVIESTKPDVVLLDVRMPRLDGIGVLEALGTRADAAPCIVLTTFDEDELLLKAIARGARGFLLKDVTVEQLATAIRTVADGGSVVTPAVTDRVVRGLARLGGGFDKLERPEPLSKRELEVLRMMASGCSNKEIAKACFVAEGTVKNHVSSILTKLHVRDRTRAVLRALELELI